MTHPSASGFARGVDDYERGRPSYPAAAARFLVSELELGPGRQVIELGAGTGKFTAELVASGAEVLAVEPLPEMRARLREAVPDAIAVEGSAEAIPSWRASADAVVAAQAFHWFDGAKALSEVHRVLRPGGRLGLLWNVSDRGVDWVDRIWAIADRHRGTTPSYREGLWRGAFEDSLLFTPLQERQFGHVVEADRETVIARMLSTSFMALLDGGARAAVAAEIEGALRGLPERFDFPYRTEVFVCTRR